MVSNNQQRIALTYPSNQRIRNTPPQRGMEPSTDLLSLIPPQDVRKKAPNKRNHNHLGAPSTTSSLPGGKRMTGIEKVDGSAEGDASDSHDSISSQEDEEDADDENEADDEEPAVDSPARVNRKRKYTLTGPDDHNASVYKLPTHDEDDNNTDPSAKGNSRSIAHSAGRTTKARSYSLESTNTIQSVGFEIDDGAVTETDEEADYPRKKIARRPSISKANGLYSTPSKISEGVDSETIADELNGENDEIDEIDDTDASRDDSVADDVSLNTDEIPVLSEEDEEQIEALEAQALAREFELEGPDFVDADDATPSLLPENDLSIYDGLLSDHDCVGEPGPPRADDPSQWSTLSGLLYYDSLVNEDLFSVPLNRDDSPGSPTPRPNRVKSPRLDTEVLLSDGWSDDDDFVDTELDNPFFDSKDPAVQHLVNTQTWESSWMGDSDDDDDWKYCLTSGDSSSDEGDSKSTTLQADDDDDDDDGDDDDDEEAFEEDDYDSDATDLDENLPLPTPQKDSKLKRLTSPSLRPQILRRDPTNKNGPFLGSWIADPDRPICIIDGNKKTMLIPSSTKRFSLDSDASYHNIFSIGDESDFDSGLFSTPNLSSLGVSNHTLTGMNGSGGGAHNGDDIRSPSEAFNPSTDFQDFDNLLKTEYNDGNDEDVDEEEQMLNIEDVIFLTDSEEEAENVDEASENLKTGDNASSRLGNEADAEAMLNRWNYIPVTAFKKRQQLHKQRCYTQGASKCRGVMKSKLTVADATMTPARRRKVKSTHFKPQTAPNRRKTKSEENQWSSTLSPLFEGV